MRGSRRPAVLAGALLGASILAPYSLRVYQLNHAAATDLVITGNSASPGSLAAPSAPPTTAEPPRTDPPAQPRAEIVIHVAGAVKNPGVYHLSPTARIEDAVKAAGGATPDAHLDGINLAAHVEDAQQLYVPSREEQPTGGAAAPVAGTASAMPGAKPGKSGKGSAAVTAAKLKKAGDGTVNLNTATAAQLMRLPGVGASYAQRILDHRKESGGFQQIEQIMDVKGIGEKKFEKMKPFLRVK